MLDKCLNGAAGVATPRATAPGAFDFYVLALSWSPGFCDTGGAAKAPAQCAPGAGLGFVVHGLWPQNRRGFPSDCGGGGFPTRATLDGVGDLYPDTGLARYEWRKHGTCTGLAPAAYFAAVRRARAMVTIPDAFRAPREPQEVTLLDVVRAFTTSNPGLRADTMAVTCRGDELQEVRLCLAKDLGSFTPCPDVARAACRTRSITVLPLQ